jgi:hypothetical protein
MEAFRKLIYVQVFIGQGTKFVGYEEKLQNRIITALRKMDDLNCDLYHAGAPKCKQKRLKELEEWKAELIRGINDKTARDVHYATAVLEWLNIEIEAIRYELEAISRIIMDAYSDSDSDDLSDG